MLRRLEGIWLGDLNGKRVIIIDPDQADPRTQKAIDDFIRERRQNGRRTTEVLVRSEGGNQVAV